MRDRLRTRSLYWRIGVAFAMLVAAVLLTQALAFVWIAARAPEAVAPTLLQRFAALVASEVAGALSRDPDADVGQLVESRYAASLRPITVVFADGRVVSSGSEPPPWVRDLALTRLARAARPGPGREQRLMGFAPVIVEGRPTAAVIVLAGRPPRALLREFGPWLLAFAVALTLGGTAVAALVVFRPAHRRLQGLASAAERLGAGELTARAPEAGGDEIAEVSRAFNAMAAELTSRMMQAETADRLRRQLLADVSHELMTPLTAMRGYLETLRMPDAPIDAATRERFLHIVLEETLRMERIIGDLLDLSRLEAGGLTMLIAPVDVAALFERARQRHEPVLARHRLRLVSSAGAGTDLVQADRDRLEQALDNLIANAARHTPEGGTVRLAARRDGGDIVLSVADTGTGIAPEHLPHVFDRFYKAEASRAGSPGSGLGLSIVKAIAERHGGSVRVESAPGHGTTFEIRLPADRRS